MAGQVALYKKALPTVINNIEMNRNPCRHDISSGFLSNDSVVFKLVKRENDPTIRLPRPRQKETSFKIDALFVSITACQIPKLNNQYIDHIFCSLYSCLRLTDTVL